MTSDARRDGHDGHLGDLLSALLDGELDPSRTDDAHAHLARCAPCASELRAVAAARAALRSLPAVDPPFGLLERLGRPARPGRRGALAAAAGAVAAAVVLVVAPARPAPVRPAVADRVEDHAATASVAVDPVSQLVPAGVPVRFGP